MMPYICTKVSEKISKGFRVTESIISLVKFLKGHNSIKNVDKVHILIMLYICTKFHELIFNRFRDVEQT